MGRPRKLPDTPEVAQLQVEIADLERLRCELMATGLPTVAAKIDALRVDWRILSHVAALARLRADYSTMNATMDRVDKVVNTIHRLQRDLSLDLMLELKERADEQEEARATFALYASKRKSGETG